MLEYNPHPVRRFLADDVARHLRNAIVSGTLTPGTVLPERDLAQAYAVSGTTLRSALASLQSAGLIDLVPNRSPRVTRPAYDDAAGALVTLGVLMRGVVAEAVPAMTAAERAAHVRTISATMDAVRAADIDFLRGDTSDGYHRWAESSRNQTLARVLHERADSLSNTIVQTNTTPPQRLVLVGLAELRAAVDAAAVPGAVRAIARMHDTPDLGSNQTFRLLSGRSAVD